MSPMRARRLARFAPVLLVPAWLGIAKAAPPAGKPVFIQVQGLAPTSVGLNGFITAGDFTEGGGFSWMPTSGVTLIGGVSGIVSRDGRTIVGKVPDANGHDQPAIWTGGTSWRLLGPLVPGAVHCQGELGSARATSGDGRVVVGVGSYGTSPPEDCSRLSAFRWEESTGYVLLGSLSGRESRADAVSADGRVIVGYEATLSGPVAINGAKWVEGREEIIQGPLGPVGYAKAGLAETLEHAGEHLAVRLNVDQSSRPRDRRMVRTTLLRPQRQETADRQRVGSPPRDPALRHGLLGTAPLPDSR